MAAPASPARRERFDVAVIGAGPAGAAAAYHLAAGGARVVLLEKASLPRYKTCGGGLVARALRALPRPLAPDVVERTASQAALNLLDAGLSFTAASEAGPAVTLTMRATLDHALARAAEAAGAALRAPCEVRSVTPHETGVELDTAAGPLSAGLVILANGATGALGTAAGLADGRRLIAALEHEIRVDSGVFERFAAEPRFDVGVDTAPAGYAWVFPKRDHLSVGILSARRGAKDLRARLERYLAALGITRIEHEERHGFVIPVAPRKDLARGRVFAVGDAAGLADPVTAEGISAALESGTCAARAVVAAGGDPSRAGAIYLRDLEATVLPELRVARGLARLLYGHPRARTVLFRRLGHRFVAAMTGVFEGREGYRAALGPVLAALAPFVP